MYIGSKTYQIKCLYIMRIGGETYQIKFLYIKRICSETLPNQISIHKANLYHIR